MLRKICASTSGFVFFSSRISCLICWRLDLVSSFGRQVVQVSVKRHAHWIKCRSFASRQALIYLIREDDIKAWRDANDLHFIQCACRFTDTCTTCRPNEEAKSKRQQIKGLIRELKKTNPEVEAHIFRSMENVCLDTVIAYKQGGRKISFLDTYDAASENVFAPDISSLRAEQNVLE